MQAQGTEEEEAAITLGASGWQTFRRVTLPNIKWAVLYGVILCNARAMGEFGAVSVVSGHIRGKTNTMPLHVEILYNEYNFVAAFAVASLLALLALVTLVLKSYVEWRGRQLRGGPAGTDPIEGWLDMSIEVRSITKTFGRFVALRDVSLTVPAASWSRCWGRPARARRRSFGSLPVWSMPIPAAARCGSTIRMWPAAMPGIAGWASCFSTMRCSST